MSASAIAAGLDLFGKMVPTVARWLKPNLPPSFDTAVSKVCTDLGAVVVDGKALIDTYQTTPKLGLLPEAL